MRSVKTTKQKAPFGWVGGKSKLAKQIISIMPEHSMYVEVFGGGLSVLYAKEKPAKAKHTEVINDINQELINLHLQIQKRPQSISMYLHQLLISRHLFYLIKTGKLKPRNNIQRAAFCYYLISQSFGSKAQHFAMSAKSGRRPKNIYRSFHVYAKRLQFVTIEQLSFQELITKYDKQGTLFYLDPPYVGTEDYYQNTQGFGKQEHQELSELLKNIQGKFILSYNDTEYIRELYKDLHVKELETTYMLNGARRKKAKEVLITNFKALHVKTILKAF